MYLNKINFWITLILFCTVPYFPVSFAQSENILLNHNLSCFQETANGTKKRPPVMLPHEEHMYEFDCLVCHHIYKDGKNILDESDLEEGNPDIACCSCHNSKAKMGLEEAFHSSCIPCHNNSSKKFWIPRKGIQWKAFISEKNHKAPTLCGECHIQSELLPPN